MLDMAMLCIIIILPLYLLFYNYNNITSPCCYIRPMPAKLNASCTILVGLDITNNVDDTVLGEFIIIL